MRTSLILLAVSALGLISTQLVPDYRDYGFLAAAVVLASLVIVLRDWLRGGWRHDTNWPRTEPDNRPARPARVKKRMAHVVIDGSNVMHWNGETPQIATLQDVIADLKQRGYRPGVIFDANAGYKFGDHYLDDRHFARILGLPGDRVLVVHKGEPADPTILAAARDLGAKVITNDRYRDWAGDFPEVTQAGHLVRGGYRNGQLWLDEGALGG